MMKNSCKRFLALVLSGAMVLSLVPCRVQAEESADQTASTEYEIYPTPHQITYGSGTFDVDASVNVVVESTIDEATENRMTEVLKSKEIQITESEGKADSKTNILVGTYGSDEYVDNYVEENYSSLDTTVFENYGGHYVIVAEDEIIVLGADTDAAFYGLTSLKHIFNQMDGMTIRELTIKDWADTNIRGFIEGYYGVPWSNEDRMSLMKFGGDFKMTSYIFAPKDDPYHKEQWRDLYPLEELEAIKEMVAVGNANKCRFVWTAHPFMGGFDSSNVEGEIKSLLAKFDQLYSAGVRQFGVLGDDVGKLDKAVVVQMMTAVSEWAIEKGDVYDSVFCPEGYNHSWQKDYSELNYYDENFPDNVQIFWTGEAVCQPVEVKTLEHFRSYNLPTGQTKERRSPLFWLNWPVNDINQSRLLMGKGSLLHTDVDPEDLAGVVTNPMQEAEASKVALFAVADYAWNVKDFDDDQNWADGFKYIDPDAAEELHTLAKHMSNPEPNGHGLILEESEDLQPLISEFQSALASKTSLDTVGTRLMSEMDVIIAACDGFHAKSKNESLKDELLPYTNSLKDLATAIKYYTAAAMAAEDGNMQEAFSAFLTASEAHSSSETYTKLLISGSYQTVAPGSTHLIPLVETIRDAIAEEITEYAIGVSEDKVTLTASSNMSNLYSGTVSNIADGDESTYVWVNGASTEGNYFQVNLSKAANVTGVTILNGTPSKTGDTFQNASLQYTTDGTNWVDIKSYTNYPASVSETGLNLKGVIALRYIATSASNEWPAMREFTVTVEGSNTTKAYTNVEAYASLEAAGSIDCFTLAGSEVTLGKDQYVGLKLDRIHELKNITVTGAPAGITLEISENGVVWETAENVTGKNARYVRLINKGAAEKTFTFSAFTVETEEIYGKSLYATNYGTIEGDILNLFDGDWTTNVQFAASQNVGMYFVCDLGTEIDFDSLKVVCTDSEWDYPRHGKFSVSTDAQNWTEIMTLGNQDSDNPNESTTTDGIGFVLPTHEISYNTKKADDLGLKARYLKFEITRTKSGNDKWVRFQELEINDGAFIPEDNDPTYAGVLETNTSRYQYMTDADLSTSFAPEEKTGELVYKVSEEGINKIRVIQKGDSKAKVFVKTVKNQDTWKNLGTLEGNLCEFTASSQILEVKLSWENNGIDIIELLTGEGEAVKDEFKDVQDTSAFYYNPVYWAAEKGVTTGRVDGTFDAKGNVTRGEMVTFLWRLAGSPEVSVENLKFTDVGTSSFYAKAIAWAVSEGIAEGTSKTTFEPKAEVTRAQAVTFLYRYAGGTAVSTGQTFPDVPAAKYYYKAVSWAAANNITGGRSNGTFDPLAPCNRGEAVTFLYRTNDLMK